MLHIATAADSWHLFNQPIFHGQFPQQICQITEQNYLSGTVSLTFPSQQPPSMFDVSCQTCHEIKEVWVKTYLALETSTNTHK